jgi:hypothetical protein
MGVVQFTTAVKPTATFRGGYVKDLSRVKNRSGMVSQFLRLIFPNPNSSL